jgi:hypothetical protein
VSGSDPDDLHITDLSAVEAENFNYRNTQFLTDADHVYEAGIDDRQAAVHRDIWRVRNGDLRRVLEDSTALVLSNTVVTEDNATSRSKLS